MKWLYNTGAILFMVCYLASCSDYLEVEHNFKDRLTIEKVFTNRDYMDSWLSNTYSYLRNQNQDIGGKESVPTNFADDIYWADWNDLGNKHIAGGYYSYFRNVEYNEDWMQETYTNCYLGINKACVFLKYIHMNTQLTEEERLDYAAQARFVRAYYYWLLLRKYGPIPLIPDAGEDYTQDYDALARPRNTYDECVEYITSEMVLAAKDLPLERGANNIARPTRGAALATRAKVLLYAASPLMNGNTDSYAQQMVDDEGNRLLSAEYDESKWARAAAAARDVMELPGNNNGHRYQLYVKNRIRGGGTDDYPETIEPFDDNNFSKKSWPDGYADIDPFESYRSVFNGELSAYANPELIFSRVDNITVDHTGEGTTSPDGIANMVLHQLPTVAGGWSMHGMTQKQCDSYYMADGTDCPGKDKEIGRGDGSARLSGYVTSEDVDAGRYKPLRAGVSLQYANREPRFYASVAFNGSVWNMSSLNGKDGAASPNQQVWFYRGTSEGYNGGNRIFTGIGIKKYVNPYDAKYQNSFYYRQKTETAIRYAEILLIYAEALNELDGSYDIPSWDGSAMYTLRRDVNELKKGIQPVRIRAGVPDYTSSEYQNKEMFRKKLKRERQIEFMGENHRYYDLRRWKDAPQEEETLIYGCNMLMDEARRDLFHTPVAIMSLPVRFVEKSYFWPFSHGQLQRNKQLTQNPGWTYYD